MVSLHDGNAHPIPTYHVIHLSLLTVHFAVFCMYMAGVTMGGRGINL